MPSVRVSAPAQDLERGPPYHVARCTEASSLTRQLTSCNLPSQFLTPYLQVEKRRPRDGDSAPGSLCGLAQPRPCLGYSPTKCECNQPAFQVHVLRQRFSLGPSTSAERVQQLVVTQGSCSTISICCKDVQQRSCRAAPISESTPPRRTQLRLYCGC